MAQQSAEGGCVSHRVIAVVVIELDEEPPDIAVERTDRLRQGLKLLWPIEVVILLPDRRLPAPLLGLSALVPLEALLGRHPRGGVEVPFG